MTVLAMIYCPFGSTDEAKSVSRQVVQQKLAACANILGETTSIYEWQGKLESAAEVAVLFKTAAAQVKPLIAEIAKLHSYDEPAMVSWYVDDSTQGFADWIQAQTR